MYTYFLLSIIQSLRPKSYLSKETKTPFITKKQFIRVFLIGILLIPVSPFLPVVIW